MLNMKTFMDDNFLLATETARNLYHDYAKLMPIIDYHCHINPKEIAENRKFDTITQAWLGGDHYKWRVIRANGTEEKLITGTESSDYDKFIAFAHALPKAVGNAVYHWTHLELKRYFDCDLTISPETADEIWNLCNQKLQEADFSVRGIIRRSNVDVIVTTDDPIDDLKLHKQIAADPEITFQVLPGFRPDKAVNIENPGFKEYIASLGAVCGKEIKTFGDLCLALSARIDYFNENGCRACDHGLNYIPFEENSEQRAPKLFERALAGETLSQEEIDAYKTAVLIFLGKQYAKNGWVMELHYGAQRNLNTPMFNKLGPDTGYDAISNTQNGNNIAKFLNSLAVTGDLPKTLLYSLNPNDDAMLNSIAGCFSDASAVCKVQQGSAWWFNDTKKGMEDQIINLATRSLLGGFLGMLTDSRSFLSYTRHEYFRRILCNILGDWVENGEYPNDLKMLGGIVQDISYNNTKNFFAFRGDAK
jgi:glucuronate isomerase